VERSILQEWERDNVIKLGSEKENKLLRYAELIYEGNKKFNLTGLKTKRDILIKLILGSLGPLVSFNVPRGTTFADIGTGAGIPGIPIAVYFEHMRGSLIDSNNKKISFIKRVMRDLNLDTVQILQGRIEELAHGPLRDRFHIVFSRAFQNIPIVAEMAAPMLASGGLLYIYSNERAEDLPARVIDHIRLLGMAVVHSNEYYRYGLGDANILCKKTGITKSIYPRKIPVIQRDMKKLVSRNE
jgi:16S rRNA (guanine527-N7)-methyltransferase